MSGSHICGDEPTRASAPRELEVDEPLAVAGASHRYVLGRRLGRGGMGEVLEADDLQFGRKVAIKRLFPDAGSDTEQRFATEARITGALSHAGIPSVHERGRLADGTPYYAMQKIDGRTLAEALAGAKTARDRLGLMPALIHVAHTIGYAHAQGVHPYADAIGRCGRQWVALSCRTMTAERAPPPDHGLGEAATGQQLDGEMSPSSEEGNDRPTSAVSGDAPTLHGDPSDDLAEDALHARLASELFGAPFRAVCVGRFSVIGRVGAGAMGVVLSAFDETLDRRVAVKLLRSDRKGSTDARARTLREAQAMAKLSHPNVVQVYEAGEHDGQLFIAMEFCTGGALDAWLHARDGDDAWEERLAMFLGAGAGLAAAHRVGIVHRDFKPANVLVDADGRPKVADFGLAGLGVEQSESGEPRAPDAATDLRLTASGAVMGTPLYMAPEQHEGRPAGPPSDQFAFCVSLYDALYRQRPFEGASLESLAAAVTRDSPRAPPSNTKVPAHIGRAIVRGMSTQEADRFATMDALLSELSRDTTATRRRVFAAALVVVLGGAAWGWSHLASVRERAACRLAGEAITQTWGPTTRETAAARVLGTKVAYAAASWAMIEPRLDAWAQEWAIVRSDVCAKTHIEGQWALTQHDAAVACLEEREARLAAFVGALSEADADVVRKAAPSAAGLPSPKTCQDLQRLAASGELPKDPHARAEVIRLQRELAKIAATESAGNYARALDEARALLIEADGAGNVIQSKIEYRIGALQSRLEDLAGAEQTLERAYFLAAESNAADVAQAAAMLVGRIVGSGGGRTEEGLRWLEIARRVHGTVTAEALLYTMRAHVYDAANDFDNARADNQRALTLYEQEYGDDHPQLAVPLTGLAGTHKDLGEHAQALALYERALAIRERAFGPEHPLVGETLTNIGGVLDDLGRIAEADEFQRRALVVMEGAYGPSHPNVAHVLRALAQGAAARGQFEEARAQLARALSIVEAKYGPDSMSLVSTLGAIAWNETTAGTPEVAIESLHRLLAIAEPKLKPDHETLTHAQISMGAALAELGRNDEALESYDRALQARTRVFGAEHVNVASVLNAMAEVRLERGQLDAARDALLRADAIYAAADDPDHVLWAGGLATLGRLHVRTGEHDAAVLAFERAVKLRSDVLGADNPRTLRARMQLTAARVRQGSVDTDAVRNAIAALSDADVETRQRAQLVGSLTELAVALADRGEDELAALATGAAGRLEAGP